MTDVHGPIKETRIVRVKVEHRRTGKPEDMGEGVLDIFSDGVMRLSAGVKADGEFVNDVWLTPVPGMDMVGKDRR